MSADAYPFIVNPAAPAPTLNEYVTRREAQTKAITNIGAVVELNQQTRETLHTLTLELGLQQDMLRSALNGKVE